MAAAFSLGIGTLASDVSDGNLQYIGQWMIRVSLYTLIGCMCIAAATMAIALFMYAFGKD